MQWPTKIHETKNQDTVNRDYKIWTIGIAKEIPRTDLTNGKNKIK